MMPSTNLYCSLQNRLGAMDRVLMAFTHRGIIPTQWYTCQNQEKNTLELTLVFESDDERALQKLIKSLQNQVYILDVRLVGRDAVNLFLPGTKNADAKHSDVKSSDAKYSDATMSIAAISA
ncbi:MAG: hypothetical protein VKJ04_00315 [Vampirovibrionales bacterium]|nr:hypothetical protein [Vampirovibrionales bacterium]